MCGYTYTEDISDIPPQWQAIPARSEGDLSVQPVVSPAPLPVPFPAPAAELLACPCFGTLPRLCLEGMLSPAGPYPDWAGAAGHQGSRGGGWSWDLQDFSHSSFNTCANPTHGAPLHHYEETLWGKSLLLGHSSPKSDGPCPQLLPPMVRTARHTPALDLPWSGAEHMLPISGPKHTNLPGMSTNWRGEKPMAAHSLAPVSRVSAPATSSGVRQHRWHLLRSSCPWGHPVPGGLLAPLCCAGRAAPRRWGQCCSVVVCSAVFLTFASI